MSTPTPALVRRPSSSWAWSWISMEPGKIIALTDSLIDAGVVYDRSGTQHPGAKIHPLGMQATDGIVDVDCSGFVRWAVYHASGVIIPDGSVQQHEWAIAQGFKASTVDAGKLEDGIIRIAFLSPHDGHSGHVMLVVNGQTCESHGSRGPDHRPWGSQGWMQECDLFVLTPQGMDS